MEWKRTYEVEVPPAAAMSWEDYERLILAQWSGMLASSPGPSELTMHSFFEQHPSMVPGAFNIIGGSSGHYPRLSALISRPPLPSYDRRIPDFMWLSTNSEIEEPVLIEIEAPDKRWFTRSDAQTAHLTQALGQIADWKAWLGVPHNVEAFKAFYKLNTDAWMKRRFRPAYLLIYGRRAEASGTPALTQKRGYLHPDDVVSMTFDRLQPNPSAKQLVCVKVDAAGRFKAISVPPTLKWSPSLAADRAMIDDLPAAIDANPYIESERKKFLIRRLAYWNEWATREHRGIIGSGDAE
jgi:antiviral defense system Shedu protein SduA